MEALRLADARMAVDLDRELVLVDKRWMSREELAQLIQQRLVASDHRVASLAQALELLDQAVKSAETLQVRLPGEVARQVRSAADRQGVPVGHVLRQAVVTQLMKSALDKLE
jgi:LDH2 family malate/lactate/ureidoglycolate dehydrogenase